MNDAIFALAPKGDAARLPRPSVTRILHQIPVSGLLADVLFLVVAMALGGVERTAWRAAGALVALIVFGSGFYGFGLGFCHRCLRRTGENADGAGIVPG
jgi:hypothetical protein